MVKVIIVPTSYCAIMAATSEVWRTPSPFMAVTMSTDDFVVTYFTKGAGINTLSTMIYGELKRGIKPEMYALSTLIFAVVLIVLLLVNYMPRIRQKQIQRKLQNRKAAS